MHVEMAAALCAAEKEFFDSAQKTDALRDFNEINDATDPVNKVGLVIEKLSEMTNPWETQHKQYTAALSGGSIKDAKENLGNLRKTIKTVSQLAYQIIGVGRVCKVDTMGVLSVLAKLKASSANAAVNMAFLNSQGDHNANAASTSDAPPTEDEAAEAQALEDNLSPLNEPDIPGLIEEFSKVGNSVVRQIEESNTLRAELEEQRQNNTALLEELATAEANMQAANATAAVADVATQAAEARAAAANERADAAEARAAAANERADAAEAAANERADAAEAAANPSPSWFSRALTGVAGFLIGLLAARSFVPRLLGRLRLSA